MNNLDTILSNIKAENYKLTPVRKFLIKVLFKNPTPLSINDMMLQLESKKIKPNKSTIYREIRFLKNLGLLKEVDFGEGKKMYEISKHHHHHIRCIKCGTIEEIILEKELDSEKKRIMEKTGFKQINHSLEFFGLCSNCQFGN